MKITSILSNIVYYIYTSNTQIGLKKKKNIYHIISTNFNHLSLKYISKIHRNVTMYYLTVVNFYFCPKKKLLEK